MASSQNFFIWFWGVLIWQRGLIPRRTKSCGGVSDPAELNLAGYQTPQNNGRVVYILKQTLVLQGIKPQGTTFKYEYFRELETEFKNILRCKFGDYMGSSRGQNQRLTISCLLSCKLCTKRWKIIFLHRYTKGLFKDVNMQIDAVLAFTSTE